MNLQPPADFLSGPIDTPSITWDQWFPIFENYLEAQDGGSFSSSRKKALLLHCLGFRGQTTFKNLPPSITDVKDVYVHTVDMLSQHFGTKKNVVAARHIFRCRSQESGEPIDSYVTQLRALLVNCDFKCSNCDCKAFENEMLRDQVVEKCRNDRIRERLLMEEDLSVDRCIMIIRRFEEAERDSRCMKTESSVHSVTKHATNPQKFTSTSTYVKRPSTPFTVCYRCGSKSHKANYKNCPAFGKKCLKCSRLNHFAKMCKNQSSTSTVNMVDVQEMEVLAVNSRHVDTSTGVYCTVKVNDVNLDMCVDTAADRSILNIDTFQRFFDESHLQSTSTTYNLKSYTNQSIPVCGIFDAIVRYKHNSVEIPFVVVKSGRCLLGKDSIQALHLNISGRDLSCYAVTSSNSDCLPVIKGFTHKVNNIPPVQQKLRTLPFTIRQKVSDKLVQLERQSVIEKVDAASWVSPIVVSHKKDGDIRLCVDLREVNKSIIPDKYPLPNITELISELHGARYFFQLDMKTAYHQMD
ncbi:Uncharacterised protein r2_g3648 [Pycnogonum litorale]